MPDLHTCPLRESVRELPQWTTSTSLKLSRRCGHSTALSNIAEIRVAAQKVVFEADAGFSIPIKHLPQIEDRIDQHPDRSAHASLAVDRLMPSPTISKDAV